MGCCQPVLFISERSNINSPGGNSVLAEQMGLTLLNYVKREDVGRD
jgi:hypothetical protein